MQIIKVKAEAKQSMWTTYPQLGVRRYMGL